MQVVEHEHERLRGRELLEQGTHGTVAAIPLVLERRRAVAAERRQRREDVSELRSDVVLARRDELRVDSSQVLVERVDEEREREIALQLGCRAREDEISLGVRPCAELGEEPRLADARLADEQNSDRALPIELGQDSIQRAELLRTADEVAGLRAHFPLQQIKVSEPQS